MNNETERLKARLAAMHFARYAIDIHLATFDALAKNHTLSRGEDKALKVISRTMANAADIEKQMANTLSLISAQIEAVLNPEAELPVPKHDNEWPVSLVNDYCG